MRHPAEKFNQIELISLITAIFSGFLAIIQGYLLLLFLSLYFISLSIAANALVEWTTYQKLSAGKQLARAALLFILTTYLLFK